MVSRFILIFFLFKLEDLTNHFIISKALEVTDRTQAKNKINNEHVNRSRSNDRFVRATNVFIYMSVWFRFDGPYKKKCDASHLQNTRRQFMLPTNNSNTPPPPNKRNTILPMLVTSLQLYTNQENKIKSINIIFCAQNLVCLCANTDYKKKFMHFSLVLLFCHFFLFVFQAVFFPAYIHGSCYLRCSFKIHRHTSGIAARNKFMHFNSVNLVC